MKKLVVLLTAVALCITCAAPSAFAAAPAKEKVIVNVPNPPKSKAAFLKLNPEIGRGYDGHVSTAKEVNAFIKSYLSSKYTKLPLSEKSMKAAFKTIGSEFSVNFSSTEVGIYEGSAYGISSYHNVWFEKGKSDKEWNMSSLIESGEGTGQTSGTVTEIRQYKTVNGATVYAILGKEADEKKTPFYIAFVGKSGKLVKSIGNTTYGFGFGDPRK